SLSATAWACHIAPTSSARYCSMRSPVGRRVKSRATSGSAPTRTTLLTQRYYMAARLSKSSSWDKPGQTIHAPDVCVCVVTSTGARVAVAPYAAAEALAPRPPVGAEQHVRVGADRA